MNDGWIQFQDNHGINNSYPTPIRGLEFHVHREDFGGPASLKFGGETLKELTPGDALFRAGMLEFDRRYGG